jgi:SAM-dependent methyltransferase
MDAWKQRVYASYRESAAGSHDDAGRNAERWAAERRQYLQRYRRFLPSDPAAPIADVGCGSGTFLEALQSVGYTHLEGIDVSPTQVAAARARGLTGVTLGSAVDWLRARPNTFALVTAFCVLEHQTRAELFDLLDAIQTALVPGGRLLAVVPNAKGLFGAHVRFADITHELSFTPVSVRQICGVVGLDCEAVLEHGPIVHGPISAARWAVWQGIRSLLFVARLAEGADWQSPVFTQDLVFVARKPA